MNTVNDCLTQLFTLSRESARQEFLKQCLLELELNAVDELTEGLMEKVIQYLRSNSQDAMQAADLLLYLAEETGNLAHRALSLRAKAQVYMIGLGQFQAALPLYEEAINIHEKQGDEVGKADLQVTQIWALSHTVGYEIAIQVGKEAETVLTKHEKWRALATLYNNLAMIHNRFGVLDQAISLLNNAMVMYLHLGKEGEQFLTNNATNRAFILNEMGDYHSAIKAGEEAIDLATQFGQAVLIARAKHNLALIYYALGQYNQSLHFFDEAKEAQKKNFECRLSKECILSILFED